MTLVNKNDSTLGIQEGDICRVVAGAHKGKGGKVSDLKVNKTGYQTLTVTMLDGTRFKTLGKNVIVD